MTTHRIAARLAPHLAIGAVLLLLTALPATAADGTGDWRTTFDLVMRWVNFLVLAAVLVKFTRLPLKSFLAGKQAEVGRQIDALESEKAQVVRQIEENRRQLENSRERLAELNNKIVAQGEKNRLAIIAAAEHESGLMLTAAKLRIENRINDARKALHAELVDAAVDLALQRLPENITDRDNDTFVDVFLKSVSTSKKVNG